LIKTHLSEGIGLRQRKSSGKKSSLVLLPNPGKIFLMADLNVLKGPTDVEGLGVTPIIVTDRKKL
jgi:hypothetical protein